MKSARLGWLKRGQSDLSLFTPNNANEERTGSMRGRAIAMFPASSTRLAAPGLMANASAESACSSCELVSTSTSTCSARASPANKSQTNSTPQADSVEYR